MTPLRYYVMPRDVVLREFPVPQEYLRDYEALRPDVLHDSTQDIFAPNTRSTRQQWTAFDLFEQSPCIDDFIVAQNWLEIFEASGARHHIAPFIQWLATNAKKPVVISWNHDRDEATVPELQNLPPNFIVLSYNTSKPTANDLLLPFWNVDTRMDWQPESPRRFLGGFMGLVGRLPARRKMFDAFKNRVGWFVHDSGTQPRFDQDMYLSMMSQFSFGLCPRGGGLSSYRVGEAIQSGAIPILFQDAAIKPYPELDWDEFSIQIPESDAGDIIRMERETCAVDKTLMRKRLAEVRPMFGLKGVQESIYQRLTECLK